MLRVLTLFTDVSIFAINIITLLGLGLAIDYALFMVSRFREELPRSASVEQAVARTMATAGRTVAFSGLIVASSLASLLLFPQNFLRSMGFGGMAAVLVAMLAALTVLPALLAVLGRRVDGLAVPWRRGRPCPSASPTCRPATRRSTHCSLPWRLRGPYGFVPGRRSRGP
jgi:RND superfamily putative drug exporter